MITPADWPNETILVGKISGLFGVRGWMKVRSWMRPPQQIFDFKSWWLSREGVSEVDSRACYEVLAGRSHGKGLVVQLQHCENRDQAAELVNRQIHVATGEFPCLADGEYYWHQLIGLEVQNQQQVVLGVVKELLETGANDVLVVSGERQRLLPYIPSVVLEIDLVSRQIKVDWDPDF